jgi:hypothetical protein
MFMLGTRRVQRVILQRWVEVTRTRCKHGQRALSRFLLPER